MLYVEREPAGEFFIPAVRGPSGMIGYAGGALAAFERNDGIEPTRAEYHRADAIQEELAEELRKVAARMAKRHRDLTFRVMA